MTVQQYMGHSGDKLIGCLMTLPVGTRNDIAVNDVSVVFDVVSEDTVYVNDELVGNRYAAVQRVVDIFNEKLDLDIEFN